MVELTIRIRQSLDNHNNTVETVAEGKKQAEKIILCCRVVTTIIIVIGLALTAYGNRSITTATGDESLD